MNGHFYNGSVKGFVLSLFVVKVVASGIDERTLKREGVCAASLPTTMVKFFFATIYLSIENKILFSHSFNCSSWVFISPVLLQVEIFVIF